MSPIAGFDQHTETVPVGGHGIRAEGRSSSLPR